MGDWLSNSTWSAQSLQDQDLEARAKAKQNDPDLLAGLAGGANSVLLGLPELIARAVGGSEGVDKWIKERQGSWDAGNLIGGIGSMFIPGGAIAKGAGALARGVGAAGAAKKLSNIGNIIKGTSQVSKSPLINAIARGGISAAEQAIPRALIEAGNTGDIGKSAQDALLGIGLGAGASGLLAGVPKALGKSKYLADELISKTGKAQAASYGASPRIIKRAVNHLVGLRSNKKQETMDVLTAAINKWAPAKGLQNKTGRGLKLKEWNDSIDDKFAGVRKILQDNPTADRAVRLAAGSALDDVLKNSAGVLDAGDKTGAQLRKLINSYAQRPGGSASLRNEVVNQINTLSKTPNRTLAQQVKLDALKNVDDAIDDAISATGSPTARDFVDEYKAFKVLNEADAMDDIGDFAVNSGGSQTFEKGAIRDMLRGGGVGAAIAGSQSDFDDDPAGAIRNMILASAGGAVAPRLIQAGKNRAIAAIAPQIKKLASSDNVNKLENLGELLGKKLAGVENTLPRILGAAPTVLDGSESESLPEQVVETPATKEAEMQLVQNVITQRWAPYAKKYGAASADNPNFMQFAQGALQSMTQNGSLDRKMLGNLMYQGDDLQKYRKSLNVVNSLDRNLENAIGKGGGFLGIGGDSGDPLALASLVGDTASIAETANINKKVMEQEMSKIIKGSGSAQEKRAKVLSILAQYDPDGYNTLQKAGVI